MWSVVHSLILARSVLLSFHSDSSSTPLASSMSRWLQPVSVHRVCRKDEGKLYYTILYYVMLSNSWVLEKSSIHPIYLSPLLTSCLTWRSNDCSLSSLHMSKLLTPQMKQSCASSWMRWSQVFFLCKYCPEYVCYLPCSTSNWTLQHVHQNKSMQPVLLIGCVYFVH